MADSGSTIFASSTQYVSARVDASIAGLPRDPTVYPVKIAFVLDGDPPPVADAAAFKAAVWETYPDGSRWAKVLVGPDGGAVTLVGPDSKYRMFIQVTAAPEKAVFRAERPGFLIVK